MPEEHNYNYAFHFKTLALISKTLFWHCIRGKKKKKKQALFSSLRDLERKYFQYTGKRMALDGHAVLSERLPLCL